jgi:hypothetical protein
MGFPTAVFRFLVNLTKWQVTMCAEAVVLPLEVLGRLNGTFKKPMPPEYTHET